MDLHRLLGQTDLNEAAVAAEERQVLVEVEVRGDGAQDEVEVPLERLEGLRIRRREVLVSAELETELLLAERLGEDGDFSAEGSVWSSVSQIWTRNASHVLRDLDADMSETTQANDSYALARTGVPEAKRRVHRDPGACAGVKELSQRRMTVLTK